MSVFRSNRHIYVQIIDDVQHKTLAAMSTDEKEFNLDIEYARRKFDKSKLSLLKVA